MFRTYDVRGIYGKDITPQAFARLGVALNSFSNSLVSGMDYRRNNGVLASALFDGFEGEEIFMGHAPTPAVAFHSQKLGASLTASHNPPEYNGLKPLKLKRPFYTKELESLKVQFDKIPEVKLSGKELPVDETLLGDYAEKLPEFGNAVFDLAGGAVCALGKVFPKTIFSEPDAAFVRHSPEPTADAITGLLDETRKNSCLGFAFDGDGDRVIAVDGGKMVDTGAAIAFFAHEFLKKGDKIVITLDVQQEVFDFLKNDGFQPVYSAIGDVFVLAKAEEIGASFAAEKSGHFSVLKHMPYSDGVFFSAMLSQCKPGELNDFARQFKNVFMSATVDGRLNASKLAESVKALEPISVETIDGVKAVFEDYSFLIRPSNTQPIVRVSVEASGNASALHGLEIARKLASDCTS